MSRRPKKQIPLPPPARRISPAASLAGRVAPYGLLILACIFLYSRAPGFNVTGLDDDTLIGAFAGHHYTLTDAFTSNAFMIKRGNDFYRPLQSAFFIIDAAITGATPAAYHVTNIILHCLAVCALFWFLVLLGYNRWLCFSAAAFFAGNPQLAQAVAWVPGQGDLLLGLFGVLSLAFLLKFRETGNFRFFALHGTAFFLATLSKESAILLPLLYVAFLFLREGRKSLCAKNLPLIPAWGLIAAIYLLLRHHAMNGLPIKTIFGLLPFLGNLRVLPETLRGFFAGYDIPVMPSFTLLPTIGGLIAGALLLLVLGLQRKLGRPMVLFGVLWFVVLSIPGMMYRHELGSHAYDYLNHRSYLPLMGVLLLIVEAAPAAWLSRSKSAFITVAAAILCGTWLLCWRQVGYFADPPAFYNQAIRTNPESALALNNRGKLRSDGDDRQGSMGDFDAAIKLYPGYAMAYNNRGNNKGLLGDLPGAIADLSRAVALDTAYALGFSNLGRWKAMSGDTAGALADYNRSIRLDPNFSGSYNNRGALLGQRGDYDHAAADFQKAIDLDPRFSEAMLNLGRVKLYRGDRAGACVEWQEADRLGNPRVQGLLQQYCR
jgi:tetratricopeptide (TPR) repeat protein